MTGIFWAMLGGALGSGLRFGTSRLIPFHSHSFPWATFVVNLIGCFFIGWLAGFIEKRTLDAEHIKWFWMSGICGGFTTFSAFSLETITLIQHERWALAIGYVLSSVLLGILLSWAGWQLMRS
jgi:CrcB protein